MRNYKTIGDINDIKGFFEKYSEIKPDNFNELFENATNADIQTMDFILSDLYGSKVLLSKYADMSESSGADSTMQRIVLISDKMCFENWKAIKESIETALTQDMEKPLKSIKTVSSEKTGENATENMVNAFDSETASDSDNSSHNYTDNIESTETTSYSNGKTTSENAKKFIDFANNNDFIENIIKDVLNVSCIDVFDDNYICGRSSGSSGGSGDIADLKNRVEEIESVIPSNATAQNKLATMSDIPSGSGGSVPLYKETSQNPILFSHILSGAGKTLSDLPLSIKIDFAGTYNNNNVYDSCIFELTTFDGGTQSTGTIKEMAKSSSVKFWKYANSIVVSGSTNDNVYAVGTYLFTVF